MRSFALLAGLTACHHTSMHAPPPSPPAAMTEAAIAVPIARGRTEAWEHALADLIGPRYDEYRASRARFGLTGQTTFLQQTPMGDFALIHLTGPDVHASFHAMSASRDAWDVKWREMTLDLHGMDFAKGERVMPKIALAFQTDGDGDAAGAKQFMFLAPLGPDGAARFRALAGEVTGPRRAAYNRARRAIGVRREAVFVESTPMGDAAVFYWLADDPQDSLRKLVASTEPFDVWLRAEAEKLHPLPLAALGDIASRNRLIAEFPRR